MPALIGVGHEGLGVVTQTATLHVSPDFSRWPRDPDVLIRWIFRRRRELVAMVPMGPQRGGPLEEWVIHLNDPAAIPEPSPTRRSKSPPARHWPSRTYR